MADVVRALVSAEERQRGGHERGDVIEGARSGRAKEGLQFRERLLDRIEVRTVGREKPELRADPLKCRVDAGLFVHGQVVEHDDVAGPQGRREHVLDVGEDAPLIDRPVEDGRRGQARQAQAGDHRVRLPMAAGGMVAESVAAGTAAIPPQ